MIREVPAVVELMVGRAREMAEIISGKMKTVGPGGMRESHFGVNGSLDGIQGRLHRGGDIGSET